MKQKDLSGQVIQDKLFLSYNVTPVDKLYNDYDLLGALNFDNLVDMQLRVDFYSPEESFRVPEFLVIKSTDFYTENGVKCLSEAEVVLTSEELNIDEYYVFLERQERKIRGVTDKTIIIIDKEDFADVIQKYQVDQIHLRTDCDLSAAAGAGYLDDVDAHASILSEWSGIDCQALKKMLQGATIDSDFALTSKMNGLIKEEQKKRDELKKKEEEAE